MNTAPQAFFTDRANQLDASNKLPYFPADFIGRVRVDLCKIITTGKGQRSFIAEFTVVTSNRADVYVGGRYSWFQGNMEGQYADTAYQTCIGFLHACFGLDAARDKAKIDGDMKMNNAAYLNAAINDKPTTVFVLQIRQPDGSIAKVTKTGPEMMNILNGCEVILQTSEKKLKDGKLLSIEECRAKRLIHTLHTFSPVAQEATQAA
jgi:hypothetical protein